MLFGTSHSELHHAAHGWACLVLGGICAVKGLPISKPPPTLMTDYYIIMLSIFANDSHTKDKLGLEAKVEIEVGHPDDTQVTQVYYVGLNFPGHMDILVSIIILLMIALLESIN